MTVVTIANSHAVAEWVAKRVGLEGAHDFGPCASIGVAIAGRPVSGVVYSWFRREPFGNDVRATIAAEHGSKWAREAVLREMFAYPFLQLECARITCLIKEGNTRSERLCRHLGFRKEGVLRRAWDGRSNALLYGLLKSECRYI